MTGRHPGPRDQANLRVSASKIGWPAHRVWKRVRIGSPGHEAREISKVIPGTLLRACHRYCADALASSDRWLFEPVTLSPSSELRVSSFVPATASQIGLSGFST